jgi:hypothetical protein
LESGRYNIGVFLSACKFDFGALRAGCGQKHTFLRLFSHQPSRSLTADQAAL